MGLLDASAAAHAQACALEPKIRTSFVHTLFLQRDYRRLAMTKIEGAPYIVPLALAELGPKQEALPVLRALEEKIKTRVRDFVMAARTLLEGDTDASVAAINRVAASEFSDPEGLFYLTLHLAHLNQVDSAVALFERVVGGGFYCHPAMADDPWLHSVRKHPRFRLGGTRTLAAARRKPAVFAPPASATFRLLLHSL